MTAFDPIWWLPILASTCAIPVEWLVKQLIFKPIAIGLRVGTGGKSEEQPQPEFNPVLEAIYQSKETANSEKVFKAAAKLNMSPSQVTYWFRLRMLQNIHAFRLEKFCMRAWKLYIYGTSTSYGLAVLWNKPWFWDLDQCYTTGEQTPTVVDDDTYHCYMLELFILCNFTITDIFLNNKKWTNWWIMMFIHHIITLCLLVLSWSIDMMRIGTLIILLHHVSDIPWNLMKLCHYAGFTRLGHWFKVIHTGTWLLTRMFIFPFWIIRSTVVQGTKVTTMPMYYIANGLAFGLQTLNVIWTHGMMRDWQRAWQLGESIVSP